MLHRGEHRRYGAPARSAANDALALAVLGREDVAIYGGSLREWAPIPSCRWKRRDRPVLE